MNEQSIVNLFCQNCQSPHTAKNAGYRLAAFARWLEAEHHITDLEAVTVKHILAYKTHLAQGNLAPASQARAIETLRSFFRWCHSEGMIDHDPARSVKSPRAVLNQEPEYLSTDETRRLFDALDPQGRHVARDRAMLWALAMGLRVGEVVTLDIADVIPPAAGQPGMSTDIRSAGLRVHGKRSYERMVPLSQAAYTALAACVKERGDVAGESPLFVCRYAGQIDR